MKTNLACGLLVMALAAAGAEVVIENWDVDGGEWKIKATRESNLAGMTRYDPATGGLEIKVPNQQMTLIKENINLPDKTVKLTLEVTPLGTGYKEIELSIVIYSAGNALDVLGRVKIAEPAAPAGGAEKPAAAKQVIEFPVNVIQHVGSSWNKFAIRIFCAADTKVRIDNLKAVLRD